MLWPTNHPYNWPVIGYMEDLTAATQTDVVEFFKKYYAPNNASLVDCRRHRLRPHPRRWSRSGSATFPRGADGRADRPAGGHSHAACRTRDPHRSVVAAASVSRLAHAATLCARRCRARSGVVGADRGQELAALQTAGLRHADGAGRVGLPAVRRARQLVPDHRHRTAVVTPLRSCRRRSTRSWRSCGASRPMRARCSARSTRSRPRSTGAWNASADKADSAERLLLCRRRPGLLRRRSGALHVVESV